MSINHLKDQNRSNSDTYTTTWIRYPFGVRLDSDPSHVLDSIIKAETFALEDDMDEKSLQEYIGILEESMMDIHLDGSDRNWNKNAITSDKEKNYYFNYPSFADTRVGCNDVINPYWQFNRDDDICPPPLVPMKYAAEKNFSTDNDRYKAEVEHAAGMGRVYAQTYDAQQQILWIEAGIPKFTNLVAYYRDAMDEDTAHAINNGAVTSIISDAIVFLAKGLAFVVTAGLLSVLYIARWTDRMVNERITKYYSFQSSMTMYYAMVNSMLQYTAVSMGIHPLSLNQDGPRYGASIKDRTDYKPVDNLKNKAADGTVTYETYQPVTKIEPQPVLDVNGNPMEDRNGNPIMKDVSSTSIEKVIIKASDYGGGDDEYSKYAGIPEVLKYGPDIFRIMNRRSRLLDLESANYTVHDLMRLQVAKDADMFLPDEKDIHYGLYEGNDGSGKETSGEANTWSFSDSVSNWWSAFKGSIMGAGNHVGFKIERGLTPSESFSNSTGPTGLAEKFNSNAQSSREDAENSLFGHSTVGRLASNWVKDIYNGESIKESFIQRLGTAIKDGALATLGTAIGFDIGTVLVNGNGFLEIPEVWKSSSAGARSYNVTFKLRSRYGDAVSIFQSIYIPLFLLIALAAPRAIGNHSYTSPFLIRAYCKGMFHIPLGIVESLQIERGRDEFGWSSQFLPLEVNVSMGIKDLSPQLFLSMNCGVIDTFTRNESMQAYLETLSSLGLRDMIYWWPKVVRKTKAALAVARSTVFNSYYHGTSLGKSKLGKLISAFVPYHNDRAYQQRASQ